MSGRFLEDFTPGQVIASTEWYDITPERIHAFASEYDPQAIHLDPAAAAQSMFGGIIASGWHSGSLMMRLFYESFFRDTASMGSPAIDEREQYQVWAAMYKLPAMRKKMHELERQIEELTKRLPNTDAGREAA